MGLNQDLDNIKAIEDKLTANKVAKFAYTDHAYNNPLTEADGVTYYNVDNEQNIPVADPSVMNVNETVLTKGWRSQASSITRMLMNHFLGRVSYNLNKLNDNMSALLTTLRTNLSNVVNTGDSANASSGGTTKFTTGGAYNLLSSIASYFSTSTAYTVGTLITYQNRLYECTTAHSAGAWNANHFTARSVQYVINNYILPSLAPAFSTSASYTVGAFVIYQNKLYRCKANHSAGAWNTSHFELANINNVTVDTDGKLALKADLLDLAPAFSTSLNYAVGDYVTYNGNIYRCTVAHSAGAWDTSHFTVVTVGGELETKADKTSLALPTDAVLHYSFDDVPDLPDGSADVRLYSGNTYALQSTDYRFRNNEGTTFSNEDGNLLCTITGAQTTTGIYMNHLVTANKILKFKIRVTDINGTLAFQNGLNNGVQSIVRLGVYEIAFVNDSSSNLPSVYIICNGTGNHATFIVEQIYVGDGSYSTPIIDNANGQNNATNNGGIAVKGVSGKGVYFPNVYKNAVIPTTKLPAPTSNDNFSISVWVKISSDYVQDGELTTPIVSIGHYAGAIGIAKEKDKIDFIIRYAASGSDVLLNNTVTMKKGEWHLYTMVYDGTTHVYKSYEDSKLLYTSNPVPANYQFGSGDSNWYIYGSVGITGSNLGSSNKPSSFDDLLIFDRALTDDEVMALYLNKANTPKYYGEVPVTRKINGHTLEEDITLTKADVGLSSVADKDLSNVVNTGDSATPVAGGITKFTTGGAYTELNKKVDKITKVNGHALSGNVTVTKGDVGLGSVANTGDSAVPAENGTEKFTTGGAFDFFGKQTDAKKWLHYICAPLLGRNWRNISIDDIVDYRDLATDGEGHYVLSAGSSPAHIYTSDNGVHFTDSGANINAIALHYSSTWHKWFALGMFGLYTSTDRVTWSHVTSVTASAGASARIVEGFSSSTLSSILYIATTHGLWYTTNGTSWVQVSATADKIICALDFTGVWFASSTTGNVWFSTSGISWTSLSASSPIVSSSIQIHKFVKYGSTYLACSTTGLWQSDNIVTWTRNSTIGSVNVPSVDVNKNNCAVLTDTKIYFTNTDLAHLVDVFNRVDDNTFQQIACNGYMWIVESAKSSWYSLDGQHWLYASTHNNNVTDIYKLLYIDNNWYSLSNQSLLISDLQTA